MKEIEAKILEINTEDVKMKLNALGAHFDFSAEFFAIYFDDPTGTLARKQQVLRLRKEGTDLRMTFKAPHADAEESIRTREELEVTIGDFEMARLILNRLGYVEGLTMRKIRTQFSLNGVHIVIDAHTNELAFIPPYLEIEAPTYEALFETAKLLGIKREQLIDWNAAKVMAFYQDKLNQV